MLGVATTPEYQNQSEIRPRSITAISPTLTTRTQQSSQQQYEILGRQHEVDAYSSLLPDYNDFNSRNQDSLTVTGSEGNGRNPAYSAIECSVYPEYEEIGPLRAGDSTNAYLELTL